MSDMQHKTSNSSFADFVWDEAKQLKSTFGFRDIVELMQQEETDWEMLWRENAQGALKLYREEREKRHILVELLWSVVKKAGGEIRLSVWDLAPVEWRLIERYDPQTQEKVFEAKIRPETKSEK